MLKSEVQKKTRELLELMSQTGFGRMENVVVKDGCPYLTQESRLVRTVVLEKKTFEHRTSRADGDFILTDRQVAFVNCIRSIHDGKIVSLQFSEGLPGRMDISERFCI